MRSAKQHLKRTVGEQKFSYEEMATITAQVEACLNSRPLGSYYSHSPDGVVPLTPGHFLVGKPIHAYPETQIEAEMSLCKGWTLCQSIVQHFWKRWSREYLQQLQASNKWKTTSPNLKIGDVVLMTDGNAFQNHWSMVRVVAVYSGEDNLVRAVDVQLKTVIRPDCST